MKNAIFIAAMVFMPQAFGALTAPAFVTTERELPAQDTIVLQLDVQNTSQLSDNQFLSEILAELKNHPGEFAGKDVDVCVGQSCEKIDFLFFMGMEVETIGLKETISPSQFARDVANVVSSAVGGVHGSATITVKYAESNKKNADGSSESSKTVDVSITVTGGKK